MPKCEENTHWGWKSPVHQKSIFLLQACRKHVLRFTLTNNKEGFDFLKLFILIKIYWRYFGILKLMMKSGSISFATYRIPIIKVKSAFNRLNWSAWLLLSKRQQRLFFCQAEMIFFCFIILYFFVQNSSKKK